MIWLVFAALLGVFADILGVIDFFGNKNDSSRKTDTIVERVILPDSSLYQNVIPDSKVDKTRNNYDEKEAEKSRNLKTYDSIAVDSMESISVNLKISKFKLTQTVHANYNDGYIESLTESVPEKGFGKFALRSFCNYYPYRAYITIYDTSYRYQQGVGSLESNFDSLNKRRSTFIQELRPGKYKVIINYNWAGMETLNIEITDGVISLYEVEKVNPYGKGNGQLAFFSKNSKRKWKITVDDYSPEIVLLDGNKGVSMNLSQGAHTYLIENINPSKLDLETVSRKFKLREGERIKVYVE